MSNALLKEYRNILKESMSSLTLIKYNSSLLQLSLYEKIKEINELDSSLLITKNLSLIKTETNEDKRQKLIEKTYSITFKDKALVEYVDIIFENNEVKIKSKTDDDVIIDILTAREKYEYLMKAIYSDNSNFCKNLITIYESFIVGLTKITYLKFPEHFLNSDNIDIKTLSSLNFNKDEIFKHIINNKIKNLTESSTHIKDICKKLEIDSKIFNNLLDNFNEIYYRRNSLTHSNKGLVSTDYKNNVSNKLIKKYTKNNKLIFSKDYQSEARENLIQVLFQLFIASIFRHGATDEELSIVATIIFDNFYTRSEWKICKNIYHKLLQINCINNCDCKDDLHVNYMFCLRKLNETNELEKQLKKFNVSNMLEKYKAAKVLLEGKFDKVNDILNKAYSGHKITNDKLSCEAILKWPIFSEYRETSYFEEFKNLHKNDFDIQEINDIKEDDNKQE